MADEDRSQSALVVEIDLERKDAEHQVEPARHLFDSAAVPGPDLGTDVVNDFLRRRSLSESARQAQIESRVINQQYGVRFTRFDFAKRFVKLFSKVTVMLDHFPKSEHAGLVDPVLEIRARNRFHLGSAAPDESKIDIGSAQGAHQRRSVIIRARLARDEVDRFSHSMRFAL
jgi:hypothetical protein